MSTVLHLPSPGPYDFTASVRFLRGFTPAGYQGNGQRELTLAFPSDDDFRPAAARITPADGGVDIEVAGDADPTIVRDQIARMLSLDHDGGAFASLVNREPALQAVAERIGMLRPVLFASPYEAAAWSIISTRIRMRQAAKVRQGLTERFGSELEINGTTRQAFPGPDALLRLEAFPGLFGRKIEYLRALGEAALDGHLLPERLRGLDEREALEHIKQLHGIGDFGAELILVRGLGTLDRAPMREDRLARAIEVAYGIPDASAETVHEIIDGWRPFRTWVSVLLRAHLEDATRESSGPAMLPPAQAS